MKKQLSILAALLFTSSAAMAVQPGGGTGVGVSHSDNLISGSGTTIFVPMALGNQGLWMEPFFLYTDTEIESGGTTTDAETWAVGSGLFQDLHTTDHTRAYFGGRLGYLEIEGGSTGAGISTSGDLDGWLIQPTLGFGYAPVDNIMFGAEAFITYIEVEGDSGTDLDIENTSTGTALFARYFFDVR